MPVYRIPEDELIFLNRGCQSRVDCWVLEATCVLNACCWLMPMEFSPGIRKVNPFCGFPPIPVVCWSPKTCTLGEACERRCERARTRSPRYGFEQVIDACKNTARPGQEGTWITMEMRDAYCRLHELGHAHSVEVWSEQTLLVDCMGW